MYTVEFFLTVTLSTAVVHLGPDCTSIKDYTLETFAMRPPLYSVLWSLLHQHP